MPTSYGRGDILSSLPKDVLETILDMITIEDVAKLSTLSQNWREIWYSFPRFILDERFFVDCTGNGTNFELLLLERIRGISFLHLTGYFLQAHMAPMGNGSISSALKSLKHLVLDGISFDDWVQPSSTLAVLWGTPNLETVYVRGSSSVSGGVEPNKIWIFKEVNTMQKIPNLRTVKLTGLRGLVLECKFIAILTCTCTLVGDFGLEYDVDVRQKFKLISSLANVQKSSPNIWINLSHSKSVLL